MSVDILQDKIRKLKNPMVLELAPSVSDIPPHILDEEADQTAAVSRFSKELLGQLKGVVPAVRVSLSAYALLGPDGLAALTDVLRTAGSLGYYVVLDAPEILSVRTAAMAAQTLLGNDSPYPCDGVILSAYLGSDVIKPFLRYCKEEKKDIYVVTRTANKSAPELQDLLAGSRLVHIAAADHVNRYGSESVGKCGYSRVGIIAAASSAESIRMLRTKYPRLFLLLDGLDYPNANAKNCSYAFDRFGHGAAVCAGTSIICAWKDQESDGREYLAQALAAAERIRKNLTRYVAIL